MVLTLLEKQFILELFNLEKINIADTIGSSEELHRQQLNNDLKMIQAIEYKLLTNQ